MQSFNIALEQITLSDNRLFQTTTLDLDFTVYYMIEMGLASKVESR